MLGLTSLGTVHTAFGLVAVIVGYALLLRHGRIGQTSTLDRTYIGTTAITCLTSFGIFQHGGFNIAHVLGILTLVTLAAAILAPRLRALGRLGPYVETLGLTLTLFFHMIPGLNETFSRFPLGAPLFTGPDDPQLQKVIGVVLLVFAIGMAWQVRQLRRAPPPLVAAQPA